MPEQMDNKPDTSKAFSNIAKKVAEMALSMVMDSLAEAAEFQNLARATAAAGQIQKDPIDRALQVVSSYSKAGVQLSPQELDLLGQQVNQQAIVAGQNIKSLVETTARQGPALQTTYGAQLQQAADTLDAGSGAIAYEKQRAMEESWKYYPKKWADQTLEYLIGDTVTERAAFDKVVRQRTEKKQDSFQLPVFRGD